MLRDCESNHCHTRRTKTVAWVSMLVMVGFSIWTFHGRLVVQLVLLATSAIGAVFVLSIPTRKP